jgi:hypothetical protein
MKTLSSGLLKSKSGNTLILTVSILVVVGLAMSGYLLLVGDLNRSVVRSQTWNSAIPVAEAGIEEALAHLNHDCLGNSPGNAAGTLDWTAGGWTETSGVYTLRRSLGSADIYYVVTISNTASPVIVATGYVPAPAFTSRGMYGLLGVANTESGQTNPPITRAVRVTTQVAAIFGGAMVAKGKIDMNGNNIKTDSFDSRNPIYSNGGLYDSTKNKDNGNVATDLDVVNSLSIGNANIWGHTAVGPGGTMTVGANGKVGGRAWQTDGSSSGIQPGWASDDMNVDFPEVKPPFTSGYFTPGPGDVTTQVITASVSTNSTATWPGGSGPIYTNTVVIVTNVAPASGTYSGAVTNYYGSVTTNTYPSSGVMGTVTTNFLTITTNTLPASYYAVNSTNWSSAVVSATYPAAGAFAPGSVITNTTSTTATTKPVSGYIGNISTNTAAANSSTFPLVGTYTAITKTNYTGNSSNVKSYDYVKITGYTYNKVTGYTYSGISDYTVTLLKSYTYNTIVGYGFAKIVSYSLSATTYTTNSTTTHYDFVMYDGNYKLTSTLSGKVYVGGNAVLYQTGNIDLKGNSDGITLAPGKTFKLYMAGASADIGGNGIINPDGLADRFFYYGLPSNTYIKFHGNGGFTGAIYAPNADFALSGGGNDTTDFIGSSVTKSVGMNGHFNFHYDENLSKVGGNSGYAIASWEEL